MSIEYIAGGAFILLLITVNLWAYDEAVNPKNRIEHSDDGLRFPTLRGVTYSGKVVMLPGGIEGDIALLLIPFQAHQQSEVDSWIPHAVRLADRFHNFTHYELSTIERIPAVARAVMNSEIRPRITDPGSRDSSLTLYLDKASFQTALGIKQEDQITVLLINSEGKILWRVVGAITASKEHALNKMVSAHLN